jgi:hypothetical protein
MVEVYFGHANVKKVLPQIKRLIRFLIVNLKLYQKEIYSAFFPFSLNIPITIRYCATR